MLLVPYLAPRGPHGPLISTRSSGQGLHWAPSPFHPVHKHRFPGLSSGHLYGPIGTPWGREGPSERGPLSATHPMPTAPPQPRWLVSCMCACAFCCLKDTAEEDSESKGPPLWLPGLCLPLTSLSSPDTGTSEGQALLLHMVLPGSGCQGLPGATALSFCHTAEGEVAGPPSSARAQKGRAPSPLSPEPLPSQSSFQAPISFPPSPPFPAFKDTACLLFLPFLFLTLLPGPRPWGSSSPTLLGAFGGLEQKPDCLVSGGWGYTQLKRKAAFSRGNPRLQAA